MTESDRDVCSSGSIVENVETLNGARRERRVSEAVCNSRPSRELDIRRDDLTHYLTMSDR